VVGKQAARNIRHLWRFPHLYAMFDGKMTDELMNSEKAILI
jgi:hypothetical protein